MRKRTVRDPAEEAARAEGETPGQTPGVDRLLRLQQSAGNAAVGRLLSTRPAGRRLSRLEVGPPNSAGSGGVVTWAPVDINALTARECWQYLTTLNDPRNQAALAALPAMINRGIKDTVRVATGDKALLEARLRAQLPTAVTDLKNAMGGSAAIFNARHIGSPNAPGSAMNLPASTQPIEEQLAGLIDNAAAEARIVGFDEWLMGKLILLVKANGASSPEQQQQQGDTINELRETFAQLAATAGTTTTDVRETAIPGTNGPTADITLSDSGNRAGQVEVKTVRAPIKAGRDLIGQLGPACSKFQNATHADNTAVVYASYDTTVFAHPDSATDPVTLAAAEYVLGRLNAAASLQGKENCREVIVRMENGKSFKFDGSPNWALSWL
jgi:hypothetical protein